MAKEGIDSFLLDCHTNTNENLAEIESTFSVKGFAIVVKLWQKIYSGKGYYCEWTNRSPALFLSQWFGGGSGVDKNLIDEVVTHCLKIGIFDKGMYERYHILTSKGIQERYFDVVKRRTEIKINQSYLLVSADNFKGNINIIGENVDRSTKNDNKKIISKVKESEVKESKVKESISTPDDKKIEQVVSIYERIIGTRPTEITGAVKRNIAINLNNGIDFYELFNKVAKSTFLRESPWCTFDWAIKPDNVSKILSGRYDDKPKKQEERKVTSYNLAEIEAFDEFK